MCNISIFKAGQLPNKQKFYNSVYNNWHSYGMVTKIGNKLDIKKKVPENGEVDPDEVWKLLEDDLEYTRFLHLRHNTAGLTDLSNCHPFDVYYDPKSGRQVVAMHNGTLYEYKSKQTVNGITKDDDTGPSDTKNFVDLVLTPYLSAMDFGNGRGDIESVYFKTLMKKFWPTTSNRLLLISSDQHPLLVGDWKKVTHDGFEGGKPCRTEFDSSNDDYFDKVSRGPEFERRVRRENEEREARRGEEEAARQRSGVQGVQNVAVASLRNNPAWTPHTFYGLKESLVNIFGDYSVYDRPSATYLGYASQEEINQVAADPKVSAPLMDWVFTDYAKLYKEFEELEKKHEKASRKIESLVLEMKALKGEKAA